MVYSLKAYVNATGKVAAYTLIHDVKRALADSKAASGLVSVLSTQATTAVALLENDPAIKNGVLDFAQKCFAEASDKAISRRSLTGADKYHLMAALTGLSLTVPFSQGRLLIHPQHDITALDYDPKSGRREFLITVLPSAAPPPPRAGHPPDSGKKTMQNNSPAKKSLQLSFDNEEALQIFGPNNAHLKFFEENIPVTAKSRGSDVILEGTEEQVALAEKCISFLRDLVRRGNTIERSDLIDSVRAFAKSTPEAAREVFQKDVTISKKKSIHTRTHGQKRYVEAIESHDIVFGVGPAGTGKTYLAMAIAMTKLLNGEVERIVLTRPAVEAGEKLGFLPGDLVEKVNPYLRPLYDALHDMVDMEKAQRLVASGQIEIAPLAFMRGRTLNDSYVILDEAQNTTREQMKMFLTRLGRNSRAVITGDVTQIDLPREARSGLIQAIKLLGKIKGICVHYFTDADVVRHHLVAEIIKAYDRADRLPASSL